MWGLNLHSLGCKADTLTIRSPQDEINQEYKQDNNKDIYICVQVKFITLLPEYKYLLITTMPFLDLQHPEINQTYNNKF